MNGRNHKAVAGATAILAVAAIAAGCSTTGADRPQPGADESRYLARADAKDSEELICRREQPTGSRISERICLTAADWDKIERQSQEMLERTTRKAQQYEDQ